MDMNEIKEIFFQECEEQLAELESGLLALNDGDTDPETVNAVFPRCPFDQGRRGRLWS
jgi:two-component system chemotaxis sensor kinase CheA